MTAQEFKELKIGDKVCIQNRPDIWGYVEDFDSNYIEFDTVDSIPQIPNKDTEVKVSYQYTTILEKAKPVQNYEDYNLLKERLASVKIKYDSLIKGIMDLLERFE